MTARATGSVGRRAPAVAVRPAARLYARAVSTTWRCQPGKRAALEMIEPEFVFQLLVLLLDRPALMREPHQGAQRRGRRQRDQIRLVRGVAPRSRSQQQPDLGREPAVRQSWAGVTRSAAKRAAHGRFVPLRHVTMRQARAGSGAAMARTASGRRRR